MSARSDARAAEAAYAHAGRRPGVFVVGDVVRTTSGVGVVEFVAFSRSMEAELYTVAIDSRINLRLLGADLVLLRRAPA